MFSPSQAVQRFFKIHHPMPLNARESQQLLNLLTTSFRKNLDTAHGFRAEKESRAPTSKPSRNLVAQGQKRRRSSVDASIKVTDHHLQSILMNPLISKTPEHVTKLGEAKDPMVLFEQAVALGLMNVKVAATCLERKKLLIVQSSAISVRQAMNESGAGLKVLSWLSSSGTASTNDFLNDTRLATILMEFIVAEKLQEKAWVWIARAIGDSIKAPDSTTLTIEDKSSPLYLLIKAEAEASPKLDAAVFCLSRAADYLKGVNSVVMRRFLQRPGFLILNRVIASDGQNRPLSESAFQSFTGLLPVVLPTRNLAAYMAHMSLFHPSEPSARLAVSFLRSERRETGKWHPGVLQLGLATAKFLLEKGSFEEASWVLNLLHEKYPELSQGITKEQVEQAKAEASSIQLLDSLSFS